MVEFRDVRGLLQRFLEARVPGSKVLELGSGERELPSEFAVAAAEFRVA